MLLYLLQAGGSLGVSVKGGVEVSSVNSVAGSNLSVEAAGGRLDLVGGGGLTVEGGFTGGGKGVEISSFSDLKLASQSGSVSTFNPFAMNALATSHPFWCRLFSHHPVSH